MPNILDADGLQTKTKEELIAELEADFKSIYGTDINLESDTPDGQMMNIYAQGYLDLLDLLTQVYNSFSPDNAIGVVLGQRVAINGIQRQAGTNTITNISIVTDEACNLYGLDQDVEDIYTVQDNAGTKWQLLASVSISGATTSVLAFQAEDTGSVLSLPNTITTAVTIVIGVASVNNPTTYTSLGIDEESDAELKLRRLKSVSLASQGYLAGLLAQLENLDGMNSAYVYENDTDATDGDGVPSHSIWVIVSGSATDEDVAGAIYQKRNAGCGMKGDEVLFITQVDGSLFQVNWDNVLQENLFVFFTAESIDGADLPDLSSIRPGLVSSFVPDVNEEVDINGVATDVQTLDPNTLVTDAGFSKARTQTLSFDGVAASGVFKINYDGEATANINWNDSAATIEGKIQAVTGLEAVTVTGSIAGQSLVFDLSSVTLIAQLFIISDNTIQTGASADIFISTVVSLEETMSPSTKQYQFSVSEENIIITEVQLLPETATVVKAGTKQFAAYGGYGDYSYEISVDVSGSSIDVDGLYTAGAAAGVDTVKVTDDLGNEATATVTVI